MPSRKQSDPLPRLVSNESIRTHVLQLRSSTTQTATAGRKFAMSRKVCARVSRCANTLAWRLVYEAVRTASLAHAPGEAGPKSVRKGRGRYWVKVEHVKRALREGESIIYNCFGAYFFGTVKGIGVKAVAGYAWRTTVAACSSCQDRPLKLG